MQHQSDHGKQVYQSQPRKRLNQWNGKFYEEREWSHGLCECCNDCSECFCAYFCTLCYMVKLAGRANEPITALCCGGLVALRTKIRVERKIKGSIGNDYCTTIFCPFCAMVQTSIEARDTERLI